MSDLEYTISRYLDGELSSEELLQFRRTLASSDEARAILREMTSVRRAARMEPSLHRPSQRVEVDLFTKLHAEGLGKGERPVIAGAVAQHGGATGAPATRRRVMMRSILAVAALLLLAIIGSEYWPQTGDHSSTGEQLAAVTVGGKGVQNVNHGVFVPVPFAVVMPEASVPHVTRQRPVVDRNTHGDIQPVRDTEPAVDNSRVSTDNSGASSVIPSPDNDSPHIAAAVQPDKLLPARVQTEPDDNRSIFAAAVRSGASYIDRGDGPTVQDVKLRFDARLGEHHRISLHVGRGAAVSETRTEGTDIFMSRTLQPGEDLSEYLASLKPVVPYQMAVQQEIWAGVGYGYTTQTPIRNVQAGIGGSVGMGERSWRVGIEVPVSYKVTSNIAVELAASASRIIPRDRSVEEFTIFNSPDGMLYRGESGRPEFTTYSAELGVRVDIP